MGNLQALQQILKVLAQCCYYTSWSTTYEQAATTNNILLRRILDFLEQLPRSYPGDPNYSCYYDDTRLNVNWRESREVEKKAIVGVRDMHIANQAIFCSSALYGKAGVVIPQETTKTCIVEIGAGYGMLAHVLCIINRNTEICMIDLLEASAIQLYYSICMQEYTDTRIFAYYPGQTEKTEINYLGSGCSEDSAKITIMPSLSSLPKDALKFAQEADAILNFDSLMEMPSTEICKYFELINSMKAGGVFIGRNRYRKVSKLRDYPFDDKWIFKYSHSSLLMPWHHEFVLCRVETNEDFSNAFQDRIDFYDRSWHDCQNSIPRIGINKLGFIK